MIKPEDCVFVLVDVQGKLAELMFEKDLLFRNLEVCVSGMMMLGVPVIWVEQVPEKMGSTIESLRRLLEGQKPIAKKAFSCCGEPLFNEVLQKTGRRRVILAGIETHVCVYQTAMDLLADEYEVEVVADAVSSRTETNRAVALQKMATSGAGLTTVEMLLLELTRTTESPCFRDIIKLIK